VHIIIAVHLSYFPFDLNRGVFFTCNGAPSEKTADSQHSDSLSPFACLLAVSDSELSYTMGDIDTTTTTTQKTYHERIVQVIRNNILLREAYIRKHEEFKRAHETVKELFERYNDRTGESNDHLKYILEYFEGQYQPEREAEQLYNNNESLKKLYHTFDEFRREFDKLPVNDHTKLSSLQQQQATWDSEIKAKRKEIATTHPSFLDLNAFKVEDRFVVLVDQ
jgi:hypothetical protein